MDLQDNVGSFLSGGIVSVIIQVNRFSDPAKVLYLARFSHFHPVVDIPPPPQLNRPEQDGAQPR